MPRRQVKRGGRKFQPEKPLIYVFCEGESEQAYPSKCIVSKSNILPGL